eukprot:gene10458-2589_t
MLIPYFGEVAGIILALQKALHEAVETIGKYEWWLFGTSVDGAPRHYNVGEFDTSSSLDTTEEMLRFIRLRSQQRRDSI